MNNPVVAVALGLLLFGVWKILARLERIRMKQAQLLQNMADNETKFDAGFEQLVKGLSEVAADQKALKDKIVELQGQIGDPDVVQELVDAAERQSTKMDAFVVAAKALDELTPDVTE